MTVTAEREAEIQATASARFKARLREAGLAGRPLRTLSAAEQKIAGELLLESARGADEMRESGDGLLDLSEDGIPMRPVDGAAAPGRAAMRQDLDGRGLLAALAEDGVPVVRQTMGLRERTTRAMAGAPSRVRETAAALVDRAETVEEAEAVIAASPIPVKVRDGDLAGAVATAAEFIEAERASVGVTRSDGSLDLAVDGVSSIADPGAPIADPVELVDITGPGVPSTAPVKPRPASEILADTDVEAQA